MRKISSRQARLNREVARIKKSLSPYCVICGRMGTDAAHLVPRSLYPEHYTRKENIVLMCRYCHNKYDNDLSFRQKQTKLYNQVKQFDEQAARRYFRWYK